MQVNQRGWPAAAAHAAWLRLVWLALALLCAAANAAEGTAVGEVVFVQGLATAQREGQSPRFLAKGEPIFEGETLNTGAKGFAIIQLKDESKLTLRPNTTFTVDRFRQDIGNESAVFKLAKGGVRALTGLVGKRNPRAVEFQTTTATIGIRGTAFDARLCENDCAEEQGRVPRKARTVQPELVVARVAALSGTAIAIGADKQTRTLNEGSSLFSGDSVRTAKASYAVLAFRDRSKVTVVSDSEFKLEDVRFAGPQAEGGNFAVRVVRGGVRALTGILATRNPKAVTFGITAAVIGLRGTGFDAAIAEHCLAPNDCAEAAIVNTWEAAVDLSARERSLAIEQGRTGIYMPSRDLLTLIEVTPPVIREETAPRPDTVDVNFEALFAMSTGETTGRGFFVAVRDGDVILRGPAGFIFLGRDEAGWLQEGRGTPVRVPFPLFMLNDPVPTPESFDERSFRVFELVNPGEVICEIR